MSGRRLRGCVRRRRGLQLGADVALPDRFKLVLAKLDLTAEAELNGAGATSSASASGSRSPPPRSRRPADPAARVPPQHLAPRPHPSGGTRPGPLAVRPESPSFLPARPEARGAAHRDLQRPSLRRDRRAPVAEADRRRARRVRARHRGAAGARRDAGPHRARRPGPRDRLRPRDGHALPPGLQGHGGGLRRRHPDELPAAARQGRPAARPASSCRGSSRAARCGSRSTSTASSCRCSTPISGLVGRERRRRSRRCSGPDGSAARGAAIRSSCSAISTCCPRSRAYRRLRRALRGRGPRARRRAARPDLPDAASRPCASTTSS